MLRIEDEVSRLDIEIMHGSLDTFMSDAKNIEDVNNMLDLDLDVYALTETGQVATVRLIDEVCKKRRTHAMLNPDVGDITFMYKKDKCVPLSHGGDIIIPAVHKPASEGGHGPRCNSFFEFDFCSQETIGYTAIHMVTLKTGGHGLRYDDQIKQAEAMAQQMRRFGKGKNIAIGSGDLNAVLPNRNDMQAVFDEYGLTTTAQETNVMTPTHGDTRLDYVWTYDRDRRVSVDSMKVLRGPKWNSDHDPVHVSLSILPQARW